MILDGCCGAGGAARGYVLAGHEVWGADSAPQPNYLKSGAAGLFHPPRFDTSFTPSAISAGKGSSTPCRTAW